jgi:hypothetical protein
VNTHALLAAIPGLNPKLEERDAEIQALKRQNGCETEFFHGKNGGLLVLAVVTRMLVTYEQPPY